jgi:hypothetical protein
MKLRLLDSDYAICKVEDFSRVNFDAEFVFLAKTDEEYSIVCPSADLPANHTAVEYNWRAFRIEGQLDFSLVGIISKISAILAGENIGLFVVSTYITDYVLVKAYQLEQAVEALKQEGYQFDA